MNQGNPTIQQFEQNLVRILSPNNEHREQAESNYYSLLKNNCNLCVSYLLRILRNSQNTEARCMASVLLRKSINWTDRDSVWEKLDPQVKVFVKSNLIQILVHEKENVVRTKIRYCIANFISGMAKKNESVGYMPEILRWGMGDNPLLIEDSLYIIQYLCTFLDDKVKRFLQNMKSLLAKSLQHPNNRLKTAALRTTCCLISSSIGKDNRAEFRPVIPLMLNVLSHSLNNRDFETAKTCIECFIEIAIEEPVFFKQHIAKVIYAMFTIAGAPSNVDQELRQLGMEFINTFAETAPSIAKTVPNLVENIFPLCLKYMCSITFDPNEFNGKYDDDTEISNYDVGIETLDRLSKALGGRQMSPVVFRTIPKFINDTQNWKNRMIGLMAICQCTEGCKPYFRSHLDNMMKMILQLFHDPHPRVRFAAIQTMAQLSTDFKTEGFLAKYHRSIFPCVLKLLEDQSPKVRSHAATSVINLIENGEENSHKYLMPFLDRILFLLVNKLLKTPIRYVQNQALAAITVIISKTKQFFKKYYGAMMPLLLEILRSTHIVDDGILRARAIECAGALTVAVGKDMFAPHMREFIELLKRTENSPMLKYENPQVNYIQSCWPKIAQVMGRDFIPILETVIPPILKMVKQEVDVLINDIDVSLPNDENGNTDRVRRKVAVSEVHQGYQTVQLTIKGVGEKRITVKTSVLADQIFGIHLLTEYGKNLGDLFYPWVQRVAQAVVPFLNEHVLEEVKDEVVKIVPVLLDVVISAMKKNMCPTRNIKQLFDYIFDACCTSLEEMDDVKNAIIYTTVYYCMERIHVPCISNTHMERFMNSTKSNVLYALMNRETVMKLMVGEENEERGKELDEEKEDHTEFLLVIQETLGKVMKNHPYCIQLFFNLDMHKMFFSLLDPKRPVPSDQKLALCVFVDIIECGMNKGVIPEQLNLIEKVFPAFINYAQNSYEDIRQASVYGLGAFAQFGGKQIGPSHCRQAIQVLVKNIQHQDAKDPVNAPCTANAVSALYKFVQFRSNNTPGVDAKALSLIWLQALPVSGDTIESRIVHHHLLLLITKKHPMIKEKYGFVMGILNKIVNTDLVYHEDRRIIRGILGPNTLGIGGQPPSPQRQQQQNQPPQGGGGGGGQMMMNFNNNNNNNSNNNNNNNNNSSGPPRGGSGKELILDDDDAL